MEELQNTPPEVSLAANEAISSLLPKKSAPRYEMEYKKFISWCENKDIKKYSESCLLAYFNEIKEKKSLWSIYSMLKSCLDIKHNVQISKYTKLIAFIKRQTEHHVPKKSLVLYEENITQFFTDAPDKEFLMIKAALIMGISGACRREELSKMTIQQIDIKSDMIIISIPDTKTNISRMFAITKSEWIAIILSYIKKRSESNVKTDRFFVTYRNGRCVNMPVGINTIGKIPCYIAKFLKLKNPELYTGHCFRRSSATLLANKGGDMISIKRHGGWRSSTVAEGYIDESVRSKIDVAQTLTEPGPSSRLCDSQIVDVQASSSKSSISQANQLVVPGVAFSSCENCTINVHVYNYEQKDKP